MRDIDPAIITQLRAKELKPVLTLDLVIDDVHYRYTDLDVPLGTQFLRKNIVNSPAVHCLSVVNDQAFVRLDGLDLSPYRDTLYRIRLDSFAGTFEALKDEAEEVIQLESGAGIGLEGSGGSSYWATGYITHVGGGEALGTEIATGTLTAGKLYKITATEDNHFYTGCAVDEYFTASGTEGCDASNKVKEVTDCAADGVWVESQDEGVNDWIVGDDFDENATGYVVTIWGERYTPRRAKIAAAQYSLGTVVDSIRIELDNLDSYFTPIFVGGEPQGGEVTLQQLILNADGHVIGHPITWFKGEIDDWELTESMVSFTTSSEMVRWNQRTLAKHSASCRWKQFKGARCAYAGDESWCDRTYTRCLFLGNQANFGGFRWLPSIMDTEIWWGRERFPESPQVKPFLNLR